ncbi:MBL fold metallo-hydrolase [Streptomyces sp. NBC_00963]|uniref:MBL fold metallo-hydrolase n=1 Tax=Streptomyces sp. NBC_00963 TaxID=2903697 RepID=UPI00386C0908|nr:MBL fold metallo-hydrolase [Streptomyces sp. NBC_00963]
MTPDRGRSQDRRQDRSDPSGEDRPRTADGPLSRRQLLGASAAVLAAGGTAATALGTETAEADTARAAEVSPASNARPARVSPAGTEVFLLGTAGGPPPVTTRAGTASALSVRGKVYVVDCGRSAVTQYGRTGLRFQDLTSVFITHLHIDHIADYANFVLLAAHGVNDVGDAVLSPFDAYGPGPAGALPDAYGGGRPGTVDPADPTPGLKDLTEKSLEATAYSSNIFMRESGRPDPHTHVDVHEIELPPGTGADPVGNTAPDMEPFLVMDDGTVRVSAVLVPHGLVFPCFAYRFDTPDGSVVFSGDTALSDNMVRLARGADILVHEVIDLDFYRNSTGYSEALLHHMAAAHTDVTEVGPLARRCGVHTLVLTHITPADTFLVPHDSWRRRAQQGFHGRVLVGNDLDRIRLGR